MTDDGTTTIAAGATVTLPSATVGLWDTRVLENAGTVLVASADRGITFSGTPRFVNQATGILRKTVGSSTATATTSFITVPVENDGKVESVADKGILALSSGSGTSTGAYGSAGAAGVVQLGTSPHTLGGGARLLHGSLLNGALTIASGTVTAADTTLAGGSVGGPGALTVTSGTFTWSGGNMAGSGVTTIASGATGTITSSVGLRETRRMDVGGVLQIAGDHSLGDVDTALLHVLAGGRLRKTATAATGLRRSFVSVPVRNDGVVESLAGNLELFRGANVAEAGTYEGKDADERVVLSGTDHVLGGERPAARLQRDRRRGHGRARRHAARCRARSGRPAGR